MLTSKELNELMGLIQLKQFKEEVTKKNETRGRKQVDLFNHWFEPFQCVTDYSDLAGWVDDVLTGAGRLSSGNSKVSPMLIFHLIKNMPFITTSEIKSHLNRKRAITTGDTVHSDRYCSWLRSVVLSAIRSLDYHTERGSKLIKQSKVNDFFTTKEDAAAWEHERNYLDSNNCYPQSEEELSTKLADCGFTSEQIATYLAARKEAN